MPPLMPNFLVIGAAKSGTTSLYHYLKQHPAVFMSSIKETNFFALEGKQINFQGPKDMDYIGKFSVNSIEAYQEFFRNTGNAQAIGEVSPFYLYDENSALNIYNKLPSVRLIAVLRNPVDRAFSSYLMLRRDNREPVKSFHKALDLEKVRIENNWEFIWRYLDVGFYGKQLKRYYKLFDKKQILIIFYEDFESRPLEIMQNIFDFLDIDKNFQPCIDEKFNASMIEKNRMLAAFLRNQGLFKKSLRCTLPDRWLEKGYDILCDWNMSKPKLPIWLRKKLISIYTDDVSSLQDLLNVNLSHWLEA